MISLVQIKFQRLSKFSEKIIPLINKNNSSLPTNLRNNLLKRTRLNLLTQKMPQKDHTKRKRQDNKHKMKDKRSQN